MGSLAARQTGATKHLVTRLTVSSLSLSLCLGQVALGAHTIRRPIIDIVSFLVSLAPVNWPFVLH